MLSESDLNPCDRRLIELLGEGRVTAPYAAQETGYSLQYVRDRLGRLAEHSHVERIHDGLYELVDNPRK